MTYGEISVVDVYLFIYTFLKSLYALFSRVDKFLRHSTPIQVSPTNVYSHVDRYTFVDFSNETIIR